MFYPCYFLSFLSLFYVFHPLVSGIANDQAYRYQQYQPVVSQGQPQYYSGYHKITTYPDANTQYYRSYHLNGSNYHEHLYTTNGQRVALPDQRSSASVEYRNLPSPYYTATSTPPRVQPPYAVPQSVWYQQVAQPVSQPIAQRMTQPVTQTRAQPQTAPITPNTPRYDPALQTNTHYYDPNYQNTHQNERTNTINTRQVANEVTVPVPFNGRDESTSRIIDYFSSDFFKSNVKQNRLTTVTLFQNTILGSNINDDQKEIGANLEKTKLSFDNGTSDCKPMMTIVKFGNINKPEEIYNPSSVQVLRCPQACFSWQFDCIPVNEVLHNFTAAVYTMESGKVIRKVKQFQLPSHTECACQCKTMASCLSSSSLSSKRPI